MCQCVCMCACVRANPASLSRQFQSDFKYVDEQNEHVEKHNSNSSQCCGNMKYPGIHYSEQSNSDSSNFRPGLITVAFLHIQSCQFESVTSVDYPDLSSSSSQAAPPNGISVSSGALFRTNS